MLELVDTGQIAELLGVSRGHVTDRMIKREDFPAPKVDINRRLRRWDLAEVLEWAKGQSSRDAIPDADSQ